MWSHSYINILIYAVQVLLLLWHTGVLRLPFLGPFLLTLVFFHLLYGPTWVLTSFWCLGDVFHRFDDMWMVRKKIQILVCVGLLLINEEFHCSILLSYHKCVQERQGLIALFFTCELYTACSVYAIEMIYQFLLTSLPTGQLKKNWSSQNFLMRLPKSK